MNDSKINNPMIYKKKGMSLKTLLIIIILIALITAFLFIFYQKRMLERNQNNDDNINEPLTKPNDELYNGIYKLNNIIVKVHKLPNDIMVLFIDFQTSYSFIKINYHNNDYDIKIDENITVKFKNNTLEIISSMEYFPSGVYIKEKDYTRDLYYDDFYGNLEYLDSKYNGYFKDADNNIIFKMYQINEKYVRVNIIKNKSSLYLNFMISDDGTLLSLNNKFELDGNYKIILEKENVTFKTINSNIDNSNDGKFFLQNIFTFENIYSHFEPFDYHKSKLFLF